MGSHSPSSEEDVNPRESFLSFASLGTGAASDDDERGADADEISPDLRLDDDAPFSADEATGSDKESTFATNGSSVYQHVRSSSMVSSYKGEKMEGKKKKHGGHVGYGTMATLGEVQGYTSLGGETYTSPRRSDLPSTDYFGDSNNWRSLRARKKFAYLVLIVLLLSAVVLVVFFFVPRDVKIEQLYITVQRLAVNQTARTVGFDIQDQLAVSNPNYASVEIGTLTMHAYFVTSGTTPQTIKLLSFTHEESTSIKPRSYNQLLAFHSTPRTAPLEPTAWQSLYRKLNSTCTSTDYMALVVKGEASVSFLSVDNTVSITQLETYAPC